MHTVGYDGWQFARGSAVGAAVAASVAVAVAGARVGAGAGGTAGVGVDVAWAVLWVAVTGGGATVAVTAVAGANGDDVGATPAPVNGASDAPHPTATTAHTSTATATIAARRIVHLPPCTHSARAS